jgi:hypothetical protein
MMNKRHAKPTTAQLVARMYRKQIAMEAHLAETRKYISDNDYHLGVNERTIRDKFNVVLSGQAMLSERVESFRETTKTLADHCARLLREKETLQKENATLRALADSAEFMSQPLKTETHWTCPLCKRPGIPSATSSDGVCTDCANNGRGFASRGRPLRKILEIKNDDGSITDVLGDCAAEPWHREGVLCALCNRIGL